MLRWKRGRGIVFSAACLGLAFAASLTGAAEAEAADNSSIIEKLTVTFDTTYGEPGEIPEPVITVDGRNCVLEDYQYRTDYDKWKPGKKVRVELTLTTSGGLYFPESMSSSQCKVKGATFVSAKSLDESRFQVKVDYKPVTVLETPEDAGWSSDSSKKAVWKAVDYAPGYNITLYGDDKVVKRLNVETNSAQLSSYMEDMDKTYYYVVKAVPLTSDQKKYLKESDTVNSTDQIFDWEDFEEAKAERAVSSSPGLSGPGDGGSFKGDSYVMPDGRKVTNMWKKSDGKWYYFGPDGNRCRGWLNQDGKMYYMDHDGVMCTGWIEPYGNGAWYYLNPDGDMRTGWFQAPDGSTYYLDSSGMMCRGWAQVDGRLYYLAEDGRLRSGGWLDTGNGAWYYLNPDGSAYTGWLSLEAGKWYYMAQDGSMCRGWLPLDGNWYYLAEDGLMHTGWMEENGLRYFFYDNGAMAVNTVIGGYQIGADGAALR